jgi:hypothetical protein
VRSGAHPLAFLLGTWRGAGEGDYPTMDPFRYEEEIEFAELTSDALHYVQRTWSPEDGEPIHVENGVWRTRESGRLEVTIALPGAAEVSEGTFEAGAVLLESTSVGRATTGAGLARTARRYDVDGESLSYDIAIATLDVPVERHVWGTLRRVRSP